MLRRKQVMRPPGADYEIRVVGVRSTPLRDFYHALLRMPWWATILTIALAFTALNGAFAVAFFALGGIAHAAPGSLADAFYFSVQTLGTIGYGALYPETTGANLMVVVASLVGTLATALATGLVFAKFSRSNARVVFSRNVVIGPHDGKPTLAFRVGNERGNQIVDATIRVTLTRTERTAEGEIFYRTIDLKLARERILSLQRSWTVMHVIDEESPFFGHTEESSAAADYEIAALVVGLDDTTVQTVHAGHRWFTGQIRWNARLSDILTETTDAVVVDLRKFHDVEAIASSPATEAHVVEVSGVG